MSNDLSLLSENQITILKRMCERGGIFFPPHIVEFMDDSTVNYFIPDNKALYELGIYHDWHAENYNAYDSNPSDELMTNTKRLILARNFGTCKIMNMLEIAGFVIKEKGLSGGSLKHKWKLGPMADWFKDEYMELMPDGIKWKS